MSTIFSTGLPNCREGRLNPPGSVDVDWLRGAAQAAERLGYSSLWLNEFVATEPTVAARFSSPPQLFEPHILIAFLASQTQRIRFVTSTTVLPLHQPLEFSRQVATLDVLLGGRLTIGLGLGGSLEEFRKLHGELRGVNRGLMMDEYIEALRVLMAGQRATYHGKTVSFEDVESYPKPVQSPLPLYMAGSVDAVFGRVAKHGQGWIDTFLRPEAMRDKIDMLRALLDSEGRQQDSVAIARQFYVSIAETEIAAKANYEAALSDARADVPARAVPDGMEMTLIGTPERISARLAEYIEAGVTEVCAIFYSRDLRGAHEQMELFSEKVVKEFA
ncbi:MAG TPA: TIGR03619 family F420-dependent LLM class oxidoreductase [Candidatus Dormibacteraeota bacterium]|nr:TIGR03619 family F420-dependent LLM class oxidoreductase [Candidatus Dormibacteraeota bacterium]